MKSLFLSSILFLVLFSILAEHGEGVVYYVEPTVPLSSCPGNSSCPPSQLCNTMDNLAENSSNLFSPDKVNITLIFLCGIHNCTKDLTVQNLHSFIMQGAAESRENVIIDMHHQGTHPIAFEMYLNKPNCTSIDFFNVSLVNLTAMTMICPSISLKGGLMTLKNSNLYGHMGFNNSKVLSSFSVAGQDSQAIIDNCVFKENCFIVSNVSAGINVNNSTFQSYRHQTQSIVIAYSSVITLAGYVNFTNSDPKDQAAGALRLLYTHPNISSLLVISTGAKVHFVNLTSSRDGGAVYIQGGKSKMNIGPKATVLFAHNSANRGGAICQMGGHTVITVESNVTFVHNSASNSVGGAIFITHGILSIDTNAHVSFIHNSAHSSSGGAIHFVHAPCTIANDANVSFSYNSANWGGAVYIQSAKLSIRTTALHFHKNNATNGGALYMNNANLQIEEKSAVNFSMNFAQLQGGGIFITEHIDPSIIINNFANVLFLNNSATLGGALYIIPVSFTINISYLSSIQFINNTAFDVGGAVYSDLQTASPCIFLITDYTAEILFIGNYANNSVGHHMYGTSTRDFKCYSDINQMQLRGETYCLCYSKYEHSYQHINLSIYSSLNEILSPVSSDPQRVCLCDSNGKPLCANSSHIFTNVTIYRGETFTLSACIVGYDFGTTVGTVHTKFFNSTSHPRLEKSQYSQPASTSKQCSSFDYTIYSNQSNEILLLQTSALPAFFGDIYQYKHTISSQILDYTSHDRFGCIKEELLMTPVFINVTLLPGCPSGLTLNEDHTTCSCYPVLANDGIKCLIQNKTGLLQWNSTMWVYAIFNGSHSTGIIYNQFCPLHYCKSGDKTVNIRNDPSKQCAPNRIGILCGACMENFSLAIGSSQCIKCPNSHNLSLLLAFAVAGVFLVFFILALNLTVTQGLINGLIFYANILWAYKIILFPSDIGKSYLFTVLQIFIAWLNLDFGIENCFIIGLNAFWKTWLQFLFPLYIWAIAGVIVVACHYSSRLTNLIGSRAVPLLATLFLLSYMKLFHTIIDATSVAVIAQYPKNTSYIAWYLDGNLCYCQHPHIYLFIAAIVTLVFLWFPYTLLLLFIQPLRRVSHLRPLKWINKLAPVFDAYFSPLKHKHQYWFGTMLLVRGILLVLLTITSVAKPKLNIFILFQFMAFLFFFISVKNVYKRMNVRVFESATLLNLIVLSAGTLYKWESTVSRKILLKVSIGIAFVQFCVIVVWSLIKPCLSTSWRSQCRKNQYYNAIDKNADNDDITHERIEDPELEPLINYTSHSQPDSMAASAKYTATVAKVDV